MADDKYIYVKNLCCPYCENPLRYNFDYNILSDNISKKNNTLNICITCQCDKMFLLKIFGVDKYETKPALDYLCYGGQGEMLVGQKSKPQIQFVIYCDSC